MRWIHVTDTYVGWQPRCAVANLVETPRRCPIGGIGFGRVWPLILYGFWTTWRGYTCASGKLRLPVEGRGLQERVSYLNAKQTPNLSLARMEDYTFRLETAVALADSYEANPRNLEHPRYTVWHLFLLQIVL